MAPKMKRGIGLLVVALIGWILVAVGGSLKFADDGLEPLGNVVQVLAYIVAIVALIGGLVMIAWSLLRD